MVKKGSYKTRRFKRRIHRKWWVFQLRTKYYIGWGIYYSILGIFKINEMLFPKKILRIVKVGWGLWKAEK